MYYRFAGDAQLAAIGILAFAAIAQLAPAFFGGLIWRRATARGAIAGMTIGILTWAYTLLLPTFADADFLAAGPVGDRHAAAAASVRARPAAAGARRGLEPRAQHPRLCRLLDPPRAERDRADAGRRVRAAAACADHAELPAVALVGDGRGTDLDGRALSRRGAHPHVVRELRRDQAHQPAAGRGGRFPAAALCRASARLRDRRRLVAARAVAAAAQAHGLDQGGAQAARRRQRRDPLQPRNPADRARSCAPGHRGLRQGHAAGLLEPPVRRNPRPAAGADAHRRHARGDRAPQRRTGRARPRPGRYAGARAARRLRLRQRAVSQALPRTRPGGRGAHQPHAGRRHRHHRDRHHAERRRRRGAGARQRDAGSARARAHHRTDAAQCRARPRQGRRRGGQRLEDALPRRRQPRHPAAAQRRAALRHLAAGAAGAGRGQDRGRPPDRQRRCLARRGRGDFRRAARHFAARHRRDAAGARQLPHRRNAAPARGRVRAAGAREGPRTHLRALLAHDPLGPPAAAAAAAEPRLQRDQIHARRAACWSAAGCAAASLRIDVYDTGHRHPGIEDER